MQIPLAALAVAFLGGLAIALQSTLNTIAGRGLGAVTTGLLVNLAGGVLSLVVLLVLLGRSTLDPSAVRPFVPIVVAAGVLGIGVITAIAFAFPRTGLATGLAVLLLGQMLFSIVLDATGATGIRIPIDLRRGFGLVLMAGAIWLLLPSAPP